MPLAQERSSLLRAMQRNDKRASAASGSGTHDKRQKTLSTLASVNGVSKTGLAKTLNLLHQQGYLNDSLVDTAPFGQYRRGIQAAVESNGLSIRTSYGPIIQELLLPHASMTQWHYINPFAFVAHLCSINDWFYDLLTRAAAAPHETLSIIIYIDEINPGNPLRPDKARMLQAVYWTFAELPNWFLRRKDSWFTFGVIRNAIVEDFSGMVSEFMRIIVSVLFGTTGGDSWLTGTTVMNGGRSMIIRAKFAGFLADEKGLKEVFEIAGQAGSAPCISCLNVRNRWVATDGVETMKMWDTDRSKVVKTTDNHIWIKTRKLQEAAASGNNKMLKQTQTALGCNYIEKGLLFDPTLRSVLSPVSNYIRDWMHTLCSNGVAGTHLALICQKLADDVGCPLEALRLYGRGVTLPRSRGKVSELFFKDELMRGDHVRHFASDVLGMVTILYMFIVEKAIPRGWLPRNCECFIALYTILCILRRGDMTAPIHANLSAAVSRHANLFLELYGNAAAKVKFHHLLDLPDDLFRLGKALGCWVTERKNKDIKAVSIRVYRHLERTATFAVLNRALDHWRDNASACLVSYMMREKAVHVGGRDLIKSSEAILPCGDVFTDDMILLNDGSVRKIIDFWRNPMEALDDVCVRFQRYTQLAPGSLRFQCSGDVDTTYATAVVEPVTYMKRKDCIVVALPLWE